MLLRRRADTIRTLSTGGGNARGRRTEGNSPCEAADPSGHPSEPWAHSPPSPGCAPRLPPSAPPAPPPLPAASVTAAACARGCARGVAAASRPARDCIHANTAFLSGARWPAAAEPRAHASRRPGGLSPTDIGPAVVSPASSEASPPPSAATRNRDSSRTSALLASALAESTMRVTVVPSHCSLVPSSTESGCPASSSSAAAAP
mmetsp:Transcript_10102/g.29838  ORF Transcript_10102/g.29838 Transcript_10102/m.29838 type:complete len:204 (+) Transcript_10102:711-1322(+)